MDEMENFDSEAQVPDSRRQLQDDTIPSQMLNIFRLNPTPKYDPKRDDPSQYFRIPYPELLNCTLIELIAFLPQIFRTVPKIADRWWKNGIKFKQHMDIHVTYRTRPLANTHQSRLYNRVRSGYSHALTNDPKLRWTKQSLEHIRDRPPDWNSDSISLAGVTLYTPGIRDSMHEPQSLQFTELTKNLRRFPQGYDAADLTRAILFAKKERERDPFQIYWFPDDIHTILSKIGYTKPNKKHSDRECLARFEASNHNGGVSGNRTLVILGSSSIDYKAAQNSLLRPFDNFQLDDTDGHQPPVHHSGTQSASGLFANDTQMQTNHPYITGLPRSTSAQPVHSDIFQDIPTVAPPGSPPQGFQNTVLEFFREVGIHPYDTHQFDFIEPQPEDIGTNQHQQSPSMENQLGTIEKNPNQQLQEVGTQSGNAETYQSQPFQLVETQSENIGTYQDQPSQTIQTHSENTATYQTQQNSGAQNYGWDLWNEQSEYLRQLNYIHSNCPPQILNHTQPQQNPGPQNYGWDVWNEQTNDMPQLNYPHPNHLPQPFELYTTATAIDVSTTATSALSTTRQLRYQSGSGD